MHSIIAVITVRWLFKGKNNNCLTILIYYHIYRAGANECSVGVVMIMKLPTSVKLAINYEISHYETCFFFVHHFSFYVTYLLFKSDSKKKKIWSHYEKFWRLCAHNNNRYYHRTWYGFNGLQLFLSIYRLPLIEYYRICETERYFDERSRERLIPPLRQLCIFIFRLNFKSIV